MHVRAPVTTPAGTICRLPLFFCKWRAHTQRPHGRNVMTSCKLEEDTCLSKYAEVFSFVFHDLEYLCGAPSLLTYANPNLHGASRPLICACLRQLLSVYAPNEQASSFSSTASNSTCYPAYGPPGHLRGRIGVRRRDWRSEPGAT
jgi:hypothetical protein